MNIKELIIKITDITENIFKKDYNIYNEFCKIIPDIHSRYCEFIELIPSLNGIGMDIDKEMIVGQLKKLKEAVENRDKVMLFDSLNYEIKDTLLLYDEIKTIMDEG